jgi:glycine/D-amino acid oxidase-like deaminating enzyme
MTAAEQGQELHRIVIVGGGIGGLVTANHLARRLGRSAKVEWSMRSNSMHTAANDSRSDTSRRHASEGDHHG